MIIKSFAFFRPNCFQIAVRFGDTQMFYLCADTCDEANVSVNEITLT